MPHGVINSTNTINAIDHNALIQNKSPFKTFWMAGYECSDHQNAFGKRIDMLRETAHIFHADGDYQRLATLGIKTVREGIQWGIVEKKPFRYDWSQTEKLIEAGARQGIQQIWDICHFGIPDDLSPLHPMFARRFASLCTAFVHFFRSKRPHDKLIVIPINEVSFLSWLGGEVRGTVPYCVQQGWEVKYALMKAYIEGIEAMKAIDAGIIIMSTEPLVNIVGGEPDVVMQKNEEQFQVLDMLSGRICPELRGHASYPDIIGYNHYFNSQWETASERSLNWQTDRCDHRYVPLKQLLIGAYQRYQKPFILAETSHPNDEKPQWLDMISEQCAQVLCQGLPLWGVCWYPILDRPNWNDLTDWHQCGIWNHHRCLYRQTARSLLHAQTRLAELITFADSSQFV